ncbi:MAG: SpoIIE family protein phosphatase [Armatimonadetes bacterium]|nr:SpoIIE family protein phosphatase [Armatimonadota bacterium]
MLKGIAKADDNDSPGNNYGIVVALANLSKTLSGAETDSTFTAAADAGATLLHVSKVVVFLRDENGDLTVGGSVGMKLDQDMLTVAEIVARASLASSGSVTYPHASLHSNDMGQMARKAKIAAAVGVPMRVGETNVGVIVAMTERAHIFTPADVELLHVVASQAALAAWKAKGSALRNVSTPEDQDELIRLADRKIQELSLVNRVSEAVNSTLDLEKLLDIALEQSMAAVGADAGSLMLVSNETNRLEIVASRGLATDHVRKTSQQVGTSIAGWVAEHGESALITDARKDLRFRMPFFRDSINSAASVPLKVKDTVIGVLNVNTAHPDKTFDERDLEILGTVANQMAVAIENARLYARVNMRTKQLGSLLRISKTVTSTLNLDDILRQLSDEICKVFGLDVCVLLLLDELSERFRFGHAFGLKTRRKYVYYDLAAPFAARVKHTGSKLIVRNIAASPTLRTDISRSEGLRSAICIPIKNRGKLVAVAVGFSRRNEPYTKSQEHIIRPLGDLAGVAINNARMYHQKYKMAEMLRQKLVPSDIPDIAGLDIGHKFVPAHGVGGDYYDFIMCGPGRIGVVVGDVAGSDVEAAEYTTMGKYVLRTYARECSSPAEVLAKTNDMVCEDTRTEMFISLFYGVVDVARKRLTYANAGCEPAIFYKAADKTVRTLAADGMLLGIKPGMSYGEQVLDLALGDVLLVYTDGIVEASVANARFGRERAMDLVASNAHLSAQDITDRLHDALLEFGHGRITDDVAMVVIKVR